MLRGDGPGHFLLWPWLETTWTSWTSCGFAWWLGGDSLGHFLPLAWLADYLDLFAFLRIGLVAAEW